MNITNYNVNKYSGKKILNHKKVSMKNKEENNF